MTKFYVSDRWSDTSGHFIRWYNCGYGYRNYPAVQLDQPASGHKRAYESGATYPCHAYGFLIAHQVTMSGKVITIEGWFGAYHGYDNTRASFCFVIVPSNYIDNDTAPSSKIMARWVMRDFGWSNGSYNHYAYVKLQINDDNTVSILESSPKNPSIGYANPLGLVGAEVSVLFGYYDAWTADWNQWASARQDSYIDLPVGVQYSLELDDSLTLTDITLSKSTTKSLSDVTTLSDLGLLRSMIKTLSDDMSLSDSVAKHVVKLLANVLSLSDSTTKGVAKSLSDSISLSDSMTRGLAKFLSLFDTISLYDYMGWVYPYLDPEKPLDRLIAVLDTLDRMGYRLEQLLDDPYIVYLIRYMARKGRGEI